MDEKLSFSVKVTVQEMYRFLLHHIFTGFSGWFGILFAVGLMVMGVVTRGDVPIEYTVLYFAVAVFVLFYPFFNLYKRAKRQVASDSLKDALDYEADEKGIAVSRGEERAEFAWEELKKVIETKTLLIVYVNSARAFVWSKTQIGEEYEPLRQLMKKKLSPAQNRLKK